MALNREECKSVALGEIVSNIDQDQTAHSVQSDLDLPQKLLVSSPVRRVNTKQQRQVIHI